jgi:hypothetical protein
VWKFLPNAWLLMLLLVRLALQSGSRRMKTSWKRQVSECGLPAGITLKRLPLSLTQAHKNRHMQTLRRLTHQNSMDFND